MAKIRKIGEFDCEVAYQREWDETFIFPHPPALWTLADVQSISDALENKGLKLAGAHQHSVRVFGKVA